MASEDVSFENVDRQWMDNGGTTDGQRIPSYNISYFYKILMVQRPAVRPSKMLKDLLPLNHLANQSQILCGASLGMGNESLFAVSGSHDQDGRHAHIW